MQGLIGIQLLFQHYMSAVCISALEGHTIISFPHSLLNLAPTDHSPRYDM
jgi:hypothetical protein